MISECANPDCRKEFDCNQGRYFRFHAAHNEDGRPCNTHGVEHFWLCGHCSRAYSLSYGGSGATVRRLSEEVPTGHVQNTCDAPGVATRNSVYQTSLSGDLY